MHTVCSIPLIGSLSPNEECQADLDNSYNYDICVEQRQEILNDCLTSCARYDQSCHEECTNDYTESTLQCPCMSQCGTGCPCDGYECIDNTLYDFNLYVVNSVSWQKERLETKVFSSTLYQPVYRTLLCCIPILIA